MLNMLHLITNTAACLKPWQLCYRKQSSGSVFYFIAAQKSTIPLRCRVRINRASRKY